MKKSKCQATIKRLSLGSRKDPKGRRRLCGIFEAGLKNFAWEG
jgi:hypothetical protein